MNCEKQQHYLFGSPTEHRQCCWGSVRESLAQGECEGFNALWSISMLW